MREYLCMVDRTFIKIPLCLLIVFSLVFLPISTFALGVDNRSWQELNSQPSESTDYLLNFTISNNVNLGSISILLCSNNPIEGDSCINPSGLDVTNASITNQSGITDFSFFAVSSNNILLTRPVSTLITAPLQVNLTFHNIVNPDSIGSYYTRLAGYSTTNGTGSSDMFGGFAFAINSNLLVTSYVPPYLTFCSALSFTNFNCSSGTGDYIDFGTLNSKLSSQSSSQIIVATNAPNGYVIQVYGPTLTSGNNIIQSLINTSTSLPGTPQFGINLRSNDQPPVGNNPIGPGLGQPTSGYNQPNLFKYVSNDVIASSLNTEDYHKFTISYLVNIPKDQPSGIYVSSLTYVAAGSF